MAANANTTANATSLATYNECRYALFDAETKCRSDRNCADCLTKQGCRIGTGGFCESDTSLDDPQDDALNYKRAVVTNVSQPSGNTTNVQQTWHFPASQAKYCGGDDAVCNACAERNYGTAKGEQDSRFCVGADGCVCVQNCHNSFLEEMYCDTDESASLASGGDGSVEGGDVARLPSRAATSNMSEATSTGVWIVVAAAVIVVGLVLGVVYKRMRARRSRRFEGVPQELDEEAIKTNSATPQSVW